jgi:hypothetical protein
MFRYYVKPNRKAFRGECHIFGQAPVIVKTDYFYLPAQVLPALQAERANPAGNTGVNLYPATCLKIRVSRADYLGGYFMPQYPGVLKVTMPPPKHLYVCPADCAAKYL